MCMGQGIIRSYRLRYQDKTLTVLRFIGESQGISLLVVYILSYSVYIQLLDLQKVAAISQVLTILYAGPWYYNLLTGNLIISLHLMVWST